MKIRVRVKPNARKNEVAVLDDKSYIVHVAAPAVDGKANAKLVEVLAEYFGKRKRDVVIVRGEHGREKIIEVGGEE